MKKQDKFKTFVFICNSLFIVIAILSKDFSPNLFEFYVAPIVIFNIFIQVLKKSIISQSNILGPIGIIVSSLIVGLTTSNIVGTPEAITLIFLIISLVVSFYYRNINLKEKHD